MVRFYHFCSFCTALNDIRVNCSLAKEVDTVKFACLLLKYSDELAANDLAFLLRICNTCKLVKETVGSINVNKVCAKLVSEHLNNVLALALSHKTVVNVNTNKVVTNSLQQKSGNN